MAATRAWAGQHAWCIRRDIRLLMWVGGRRVGAEQCAGRRDALGAVGVGEEPDEDAIRAGDKAEAAKVEVAYRLMLHEMVHQALHQSARKTRWQRQGSELP